MLQEIAVWDAVGMVLGHDVTRIIPGLEKGPAFRRGHIIQQADVDVFLDIGKEHVYVIDLNDGYLHEDDAARRIATAAVGQGIRLTAPSEGRINLEAQIDGLLKIDIQALTRLNSLGDIVFATLHSNHQVKKGQPIAGTRVVPLVVATDLVARAEALCRENPPLIQVKPFRQLKVGMVTTGSEVYTGRIKDAFGPVVKRKFEALGSRIFRQIFVSDDTQMTRGAIGELIDQGAEMVVVTGGMSVDPDDRTPLAIREAGAKTITYGAPTFPGAMFMIATIGEIPVLGLPGCVMYHKTSIFDLVVPRLLAGDSVSVEDIAQLGHGGFCAGCKVCRYPLCSFGKN
ncbi:MAG: molybdopterin-binding protein [Desulfosarcinaceae bacterium]|jgi:molybdopterin biosynthesis enzyme